MWRYLSGGRVVQFAAARTRNGARIPPRFIVLQPTASNAEFRRTLCSGSIVGEVVEIDFGVATDSLRAEILERFHVWENR